MAQLDLDRKEPDQRERVGVAKGPQPAPAGATPTASERPLTLAQRMAAIRAECSSIGKQDITMGSFKIKAHTIEGVLSEMRPLFTKHGVHFTPQLETVTHTGNRCDVIVAFEFSDLGSGEEKVIRWGGSGTDNSDKAFAKAGTNALKEMLKKVFLVTDKEDAKEETETVEHKTDEGLTRGAVDEQKEATRAAMEALAQTLKLAFEKATTVAEIDRLQRDNKDSLAKWPDVTRAFFIELVERRKRELAPKGEE